jgi:pyruvate, water dikinase
VKRSLIQKLREFLAGRRLRRKAEALRFIKARYHIFRFLLAINDQALACLAGLDRLVRENEPSRAASEATTLYETALELADGLNRLTGNDHLGLYPRLAGLRRELDAAIAGYVAAGRDHWPALAEITPDMAGQTGGKATPLAILARAGLPVPDGFAVPRRACREYLREAHLEERLRAVLRASGLPGADLAALSARATEMIAASEPAPGFARELDRALERLGPGGETLVGVRSSAACEDGGEHSFAGQFESVLGVCGAAAFTAAFRTVLASAFSERALSYRLGAGARSASLDMAVFCQRMVDAHVSGVLFTLDPMHPESGRMLVTAVPGLGTQAVSGRVPADVYRPVRELGAVSEQDVGALVAVKTSGERLGADGALVMAEVPASEREAPLLAPADIEALRGLALRIEALLGGPRDIEWSKDREGRFWILQARPARLARHAQAGAAGRGEALLRGGTGASPGKAVGRAAVVRSRGELDAARAAAQEGPVVLVLRQSLVEAASLAPQAAAILVDMGNPLDHLACLAREYAIPMITGLGVASEKLTGGDWLLADADAGTVSAADPRLWRDAPRPPAREASRPSGGEGLREICLPLNLTDAYGPTFSIAEMRSLHDVVRYVHEKAVLAMFGAADAVTEEAFSLVRRLSGVPGLSFLIIDLGGALAQSGKTGKSGRFGNAPVTPEDIMCAPLAALCRGMAEPGLRWGKPPPMGGTGGLWARAMLDKRGERPVGEPNYALATRDYVNLNARVDYHFAMIDAVCGANPRQNSVRFRFKGGGTGREQRERRAAFIETVMVEQGFFTNRQGDMVTAVLAEGGAVLVEEKMVMLGRLLGFSRLLDAAMTDEAMPGLIAEAFLRGDYSLDGLAARLGGAS